MKTSIYLLLAVLLLTFSTAYAEKSGSIWGYGIEGGVAQGDNAIDDENMVPTGRGHFQLSMSKQFIARFGLGYTPLKADGVYDNQLLMGDVRMIFRPIQMNLLSPYIYAGVGGGKDMGDSDSDLIPIVPFGFGLQTKLSSKFLFEVNAGYNLSLSDKLDGRDRLHHQRNRFTNRKQDGYFSVMFGVVFTKPYKAKETKSEAVVPEQSPEVDLYTIDSDKDGLSDGDEINKYLTSPLRIDTDSDGLSDGEEVLTYRTNPLVADTDGDGLSDGVEVHQYKTDPLKVDTDNDGLSDYAEVRTHMTNPLNIDTDGGGLNDGAEIKMGKNPLDPSDDVDKPKEPTVVPPVVTPPVVSPPPAPDKSKIDTDGDGLPDVDEVNKYRTDPKKQDTDGDGLSDGDEVLKHRTDPLVADTDKDGLSDGLEVNQYKTDPLKVDTDGDGLSDYAELMTHRTNPLKIDSDGGGMNDGAEIKAGKNPLDSKDDLLDMTKGKKVVLEGIEFASGNATILSKSTSILDRVYESLVANPDVNVQILGHTDSVGGEDSNRTLSLKRAQAVKDWLTEKGINSSRIKVIGKGEAEPIASNDTSDGRAKNRRIEFQVEN